MPVSNTSDNGKPPYTEEDAVNKFTTYYNSWLRERVSYQAWLEIDMKSEPRAGDIIKAMLLPNIERRAFWGSSDFMKPKNRHCYMGPFCLVNYQVTKEGEGQLATMLSIIKTFHGLATDESLAYAIQAFAMCIDYDRYLKGQHSMLFPIVNSTKEITEYPKWVVDYFLKTPLIVFDKLLYAWSILGVMIFKGFMFKPDPKKGPGRWYYFSFPPTWRTAKELEKSFADRKMELPKVPVFVDLRDLPLAEQLPSLKSTIAQNASPLVKELTKLAAMMEQPVDSSAPETTKAKYCPYRFPTPHGTKWEGISIIFTSPYAVRIKVKDLIRRYSYAELGFADRRKADSPDTRWGILRIIAEHQGELVAGHDYFDPKIFGRLKASIKELRQRLKAIFGLADDPFCPYSATHIKKKGYRTRFDIYVEK
jgi:hypothetical protein